MFSYLGDWESWASKATSLDCQFLLRTVGKQRNALSTEATSLSFRISFPLGQVSREELSLQQTRQLSCISTSNWGSADSLLGLLQCCCYTLSKATGSGSFNRGNIDCTYSSSLYLPLWGTIGWALRHLVSLHRVNHHPSSQQSRLFTKAQTPLAAHVYRSSFLHAATLPRCLVAKQ